MVNRNKKQVPNKNNNKNNIAAKLKDLKKKTDVKPNLSKKNLDAKKKEVKVQDSPEDNSSEDDISEEEMKKMLGDSDNSDIDSEEFSVEEHLELHESKVNRKRKLSSDDEDNLKKAKTNEDEDDGEDDDEDDVEYDEEDEDDEDDEEVDMDDSFIDDEIEESGDEEETEDKEIQVAEKENKDTKAKEKKVKKTIDPELLLKTKKAAQELQEKRMLTVKEMFKDTPKVENDKLKKEIQSRLRMRKERTVVITNVSKNFNATHAKLLVPNMVSCVMPYNSFLHRIVGTLYVDMKTPEEALEVANTLRKKRQTIGTLNIGPLGAIVQTKVIDDVEKYNCSRLVISNISNKAEKEDLENVLPNAKRLEVMPMKAIDRKAFKTGFAEYSTVEEAIKDYDNVHGVLVKGHPINLKFQIKNSDNVKNKQCKFDKKRLQVLGLKKNTREADVKVLFPQATCISLNLERGLATITYNNVEECEIDRKNSIANKTNRKWKITNVMGHNTVKGEDGKVEEESAESKPVDCKKVNGKFVGKKFEDKKFEGKKFEGKKLERKKFEGKKFDNKKSEGKKFDNKKSEDSLNILKDNQEKPIVSKVLIHPRHDVQGAPQVKLDGVSPIKKNKKKSHSNKDEKSEGKSESITISDLTVVTGLDKDEKQKQKKAKQRQIRKEKRKIKHQQMVSERKLKSQQLKGETSKAKVVK